MSIPILLFVVLTILLYFPPFQRWAVKQVTAYASEKMGMDIRVGEVRLAFPLDLALEDVKVLQPNDSLKNVTDTVADISRVGLSSSSSTSSGRLKTGITKEYFI